MKIIGRIKLVLLMVGGACAVLYLVHSLPPYQRLPLPAPKPATLNVVGHNSNYETKSKNEKYPTELYEETFFINSTPALEVINVSEALMTGGVSDHLNNSHFELYTKMYSYNYGTKGNYIPSRNVTHAGPVFEGGGRVPNHKCYGVGSAAGEAVSLQRYRECIKIISRDTQRELNSLKNNQKLLEMAERLHVYEEACRWPSVEVTAAADTQDVVFDSRHKLSYCKTAKAGSSTILSYIFNIEGVRFDPRNNIGLHKAARMVFPPLPGREGAREMIKNSFSFTSVRHPFRRLVSAYCNKVVEGQEKIFKKHNKAMLSYRAVNTRDIVREELPKHRFEASRRSKTKSNAFKVTRNLILDTPGKSEFMKGSVEPEKLVPGVPTFREFMMFVAVTILQCGGDHICLGQLDTHFRPQVVRCNPCAWHFDFILKTETLQEDLAWLARVVGATPQNPSPNSQTSATPQLSGDIPILNASGDSCANYHHYLYALNSDEVDVFYSAYYNDFRYFGYKPFE